MMRKTILNKKMMIRSSQCVWAIGLVGFLAMAFPDLIGATRYTLSFLSGNAEPSTQSAQAADRAFLKLLGGLLICIVGQLLVFVFAASLLGSKEAIDYYHDREKNYVDVLSSRIDLAEQIKKLAHSIDILQSGLINCQKSQKGLSRDVKMLCEVIEITKDSLPVYYRERPKPKDKGNF